MKKPLISALAALGALLVCASALAQHAKPELEYKLEPYRRTIALHAKINGQEGFFSLDTAGGVSLITPGFASKAGLSPWGSLTGFTMTGAPLDMPHADDVAIALGEHSYRPRSIGVMEVAGLFAKDNTVPIDGNLALDMFDGKAVTIDFPNWRLLVESPGSLKERVATATEIPVRYSREWQGRTLSVSVGIRTAKGVAWMELDSGNGGTILIGKAYADLFKLDAAKQDFQKIRFNVADGFDVDSDRALVKNMNIDGNIGMLFLKNVALTLDIPNGRAWIGKPAAKQ